MKKSSKLFEPGGESIKRDLFQQVTRQEERRLPSEKIGGHSIVLTETELLREEISHLQGDNKHLREELRTLKTVPRVDVGLQCDDYGIEVLKEILHQKDETIGQYERQIRSFKQMILSKNEQLKELMWKFEGKPESVILVSKGAQTDMPREPEAGEQRKLCNAVAEENKALREELQRLNSAEKCTESAEVVRRSYAQLQRDLAGYKQQYQEALDNYYFLQSEQRSDQKKIKDLTEEVERLRAELYSKTDPSVSSTETVQSPRETPVSKLKKRPIKFGNPVIPKCLSPQNMDDFFRLEEENQKLNSKLNELRTQIVECQRQVKALTEEIGNKEGQIARQLEQIKMAEEELSRLRSANEELSKCEERFKGREQELVEKHARTHCQLQSLQMDYQGLKIINQQLHAKLDRVQKG